MSADPKVFFRSAGFRHSAASTVSTHRLNALFNFVCSLAKAVVLSSPASFTPKYYHYGKFSRNRLPSGIEALVDLHAQPGHQTIIRVGKTDDGEHFFELLTCLAVSHAHFKAAGSCLKKNVPVGVRRSWSLALLDPQRAESSVSRIDSIGI